MRLVVKHAQLRVDRHYTTKKKPIGVDHGNPQKEGSAPRDTKPVLFQMLIKTKCNDLHKSNVLL